LAEDTGYDVYCSSADVRDYDALQKEVARCAPDYVVHLAGISSTQCSDAKVLMDVNVTGTVNVLRALVETGVTPHKVLVPSSVLVYGANPVSPVVETAPLVPMNEYTRSKVLMERAASEFKDKLRIVIARPFNYTGCGQADTFLIPKLVQHFAKKTEAIDVGNLDVEREFNDVRDVCHVYLQLLGCESPADCVINVCSGKSHKITTVIDTLSELTGHVPTINVNENLVRQNDIKHLSGSVDKLRSLIPCSPESSLKSLLTWMLQAP
jgi:nucleoside-diphosphate-sugar epimerase